MVDSGSMGAPLPPMPDGMDPMMGNMAPAPVGPPPPQDLGSIAGFIASLFAQIRDAVDQADPMIQSLMQGMDSPVGATPTGGALDPMLGFGTGAGGPVDPNAIPPLGA